MPISRKSETSNIISCLPRRNLPCYHCLILFLRTVSFLWIYSPLSAFASVNSYYILPHPHSYTQRHSAPMQVQAPICYPNPPLTRGSVRQHIFSTPRPSSQAVSSSWKAAATNMVCWRCYTLYRGDFSGFSSGSACLLDIDSILRIDRPQNSLRLVTTFAIAVVNKKGHTSPPPSTPWPFLCVSYWQGVVQCHEIASICWAPSNSAVLWTSLTLYQPRLMYICAEWNSGCIGRFCSDEVLIFVPVSS